MQKARRRKLSAVAHGSGCSTPFTCSGSWFHDAATHCFPLALPLALFARTGLEDVVSVLLRLSLAALRRSPVAEVVQSESRAPTTWLRVASLGPRLESGWLSAAFLPVGPLLTLPPG